MPVFTAIVENPTCTNFTDMLFPVRKCFKKITHGRKCSIVSSCKIKNKLENAVCLSSLECETGPGLLSEF